MDNTYNDWAQPRGASDCWDQVGVDSYAEWIQLVAELTVRSLQSWQWASGSVFYLQGLWSRLVSSMPYLKGEAPSLLDTYVPRITRAYITSRHAPLTYSSPPAWPPPNLLLLAAW